MNVLSSSSKPQHESNGLLKAKAYKSLLIELGDSVVLLIVAITLVFFDCSVAYAVFVREFDSS